MFSTTAIALTILSTMVCERVLRSQERSRLSLETFRDQNCPLIRLSVSPVNEDEPLALHEGARRFPPAFDTVLAKLRLSLQSSRPAYRRPCGGCKNGQRDIGAIGAGQESRGCESSSGNKCCLCQEDKGKGPTQGLCPFEPDQLTINKYLPGHGIPPHIDTHSLCFDPIVSISMGAQTVMVSSQTLSRWKECRFASHLSSTTEQEFRREGREPQLVVVPARSLMVMCGEARYAWEHGIITRKVDRIGGALEDRQQRISITFRCGRRDSLAE